MPLYKKNICSYSHSEVIILKNMNEIKRNKNIKYLGKIANGMRLSWKINGLKFLILVTKEDGHEHVSISHANPSIYPTLNQMFQLKKICFEDNELTKMYMKQPGQKSIRSNCYHIFK